MATAPSPGRCALIPTCVTRMTSSGVVTPAAIFSQGIIAQRRQLTLPGPCCRLALSNHCFNEPPDGREDGQHLEDTDAAFVSGLPARGSSSHCHAARRCRCRPVAARRGFVTCPSLRVLQSGQILHLIAARRREPGSEAIVYVSIPKVHQAADVDTASMV